MSRKTSGVTVPNQTFRDAHCGDPCGKGQSLTFTSPWLMFDVYLFYSIPVLISGIHFQKMVCEFILFKKDINIFQVHSVTRNWKTLNPSSQYAFIVTTSVFARHQTGLTYQHTYAICQLLVSMLAQHFKIIASTHFFTLLIQFRVVGVLEPITAVKGWKTGYNLHRFPIGLNPGWAFLCRFCMHSSFLPQSEDMRVRLTGF